MFEQSMVFSQGERVSSRVRWTTAGSLTVQCALAGVLLALPLLRPAQLSVQEIAPRAALPTVQPPRVLTVALNRVRPALAAAGPALTAAVTRALTAPAKIPHGIREDNAGAPAVAVPLGPGFGAGSGRDLLATMSEGAGGGTRVGVVPAETARRRPKVSAGVSQGLLLQPIRPVYPEIARMARVEGTVVVTAVISKEGRIESARVEEGPAMLRAAALEAIGRARYRPYRLNGEPTAVETTITVRFRIGG